MAKTKHIKSKKYAGVYHYPLENGDKSYGVRYTVNGKRRDKIIGKHSEGIRENYCFKVRTDLIAEAKHGLDPNADILFNNLAEYFHKTKLNTESYEERIGRYNKEIKPFFNNRKVAKIKESDLIDFQEHLKSVRFGARGRRIDNGERGLANSTINRYMEEAKAIIRYGVKQGLVYYKIDPTQNIKSLTESDNAREKFLSRAEIDTLKEEMSFYDYNLQLFVALALGTGGRLNAITSVKKKDIDLVSKKISLINDKGDKYYTSWLNDEVVSLLKGRIEKLRPNDSIYTGRMYNGTGDTVAKREESRRRAIQRKIQKLLNKMFNDGLDVDDRRNRVVVHTLRHTFASHLAIKGTPIFTIQKMMDHSDIKQTLRYAKLAPDGGKEEVINMYA